MNEENLLPEEDILELEEEGVNTIQAEKVNLSQARANSIFADKVSMKQSGAVGLKAHTVSMQESGAGSIKADEVTITDSGILLLQAEDAQISGGTHVGGVLAHNVELRDGAILAVASQNLRAEQIQTKILLAGNVAGEVHTVVDTRGAILIALLGGFVSGTMLLLGSFLFGRKK